MSLINHYSIIFLAVLILAVSAFLLLRDGVQTRDLLILGGLAIGMFVAWVIIRPTPSGEGDANEVLAQIGNGVPVLLELQSPF